MNKYIIAYILSAIIAAFRPIFFRKYKDYFFIGIFLSLLSMYIGGLLFMYYESRVKEDYNFGEKILETLSWKNMLLSLISELRFITKQYSMVLLPLSISMPLTNLWIVFSVIFDKIINNDVITILEYLALGILIVGGIFINFDKMFGIGETKHISNYDYIIGLILIIISVITGGFIYTEFQHIVSQNLDPGETIGIESGGSLILFTILLLIGLIFGLIKLPKIGEIITMFLLLTFLFNLDIILKFIGFEKVSIIESIFLFQIYTFVTIGIGLLLYNEKLTFFKILGIILITIGIVIGLMQKHSHI